MQIPLGTKAGGFVAYPTSKSAKFSRAKIANIEVWGEPGGCWLFRWPFSCKPNTDLFTRLVPAQQDPGKMTVTVGGGRAVKASDFTIQNRQVKLGAQVVATIGAAGNLVAAGGGNLVAAGGGNLVAAGGGNLVAAGGGNLVAAGGGNLVAAGGGNLVAAGGGNLVAAGGGNLIAAGGGNLVAAGGGNLLWNPPG